MHPTEYGISRFHCKLSLSSLTCTLSTPKSQLIQRQNSYEVWSDLLLQGKKFVFLDRMKGRGIYLLIHFFFFATNPKWWMEAHALILFKNYLGQSNRFSLKCMLPTFHIADTCLLCHVPALKSTLLSLHCLLVEKKTNPFD